MDKRTIAYQRRTALSLEDVQKKSNQIVLRLLPYLKGTIGIYMAYGKEVTIEALRCYDEYTLCVPVCLPERRMQFYQIHQDTEFEKRAYGILEPLDAVAVSSTQIDVMIIPMVAFDEKKHRMGHGKGYYDRYLKEYHGLKIGVAFECQKLDALEVYPHDIAMDMIITEDTIYT